MKGKLTFGGIGTDAVKSWSEIEACTDGKKLHEAEFSQNFHGHMGDQCFSAGVKGKWCNEHKKMEKIQAQFVMCCFSWGDAWMRAAMLDCKCHKGQFLTAGASYNDKDDKFQHHSVEASYDLSKKFKGFQGMPLMLNWGGCYHLNNKVNLTSRLSLQNEWL